MTAFSADEVYNCGLDLPLPSCIKTCLLLSEVTKNSLQTTGTSTGQPSCQETHSAQETVAGDTVAEPNQTHAILKNATQGAVVKTNLIHFLQGNAEASMSTRTCGVVM